MSAVVEAALISGSGSPGALAELLGIFWGIESIKRVMYTHDGRAFDIWVLFREDNLEDMKRAILAEGDYRQAVGGSPIDFHFFALDKVEERNLPTGHTIFERP